MGSKQFDKLNEHETRSLMELFKNSEHQQQMSDRKSGGFWNQMVVFGAMKNLTRGDLILHDSKTWGTGVFFKPPPQVLHHIRHWNQDPNHGIGVFEESTPGPLKLRTGIGGGVVYKGKNRHGVECGWLWAWFNGDKIAQVYGEYGPIGRFNNIDWDQVQLKMKKRSGPFFMGCTHKSGFQVKSMTKHFDSTDLPIMATHFMAAATFSG